MMYWTFLGMSSSDISNITKDYIMHPPIAIQTVIFTGAIAAHGIFDMYKVLKSIKKNGTIK